MCVNSPGKLDYSRDEKDQDLRQQIQGHLTINHESKSVKVEANVRMHPGQPQLCVRGFNEARNMIYLWVDIFKHLIVALEPGTFADFDIPPQSSHHDLYDSQTEEKLRTYGFVFGAAPGSDRVENSFIMIDSTDPDPHGQPTAGQVAQARFVTMVDAILVKSLPNIHQYAKVSPQVVWKDLAQHWMFIPEAGHDHPVNALGDHYSPLAGTEYKESFPQAFKHVKAPESRFL